MDGMISCEEHASGNSPIYQEHARFFKLPRDCSPGFSREDCHFYDRDRLLRRIVVSLEQGACLIGHHFDLIIHHILQSVRPFHVKFHRHVTEAALPRSERCRWVRPKVGGWAPPRPVSRWFVCPPVPAALALQSGSRWAPVTGGMEISRLRKRWSLGFGQRSIGQTCSTQFIGESRLAYGSKWQELLSKALPPYNGICFDWPPASLFIATIPVATSLTRQKTQPMRTQWLWLWTTQITEWVDTALPSPPPFPLPPRSQLPPSFLPLPSSPLSTCVFALGAWSMRLSHSIAWPGLTCVTVPVTGLSSFRSWRACTVIAAFTCGTWQTSRRSARLIRRSTTVTVSGEWRWASGLPRAAMRNSARSFCCARAHKFDV